MAVSKDFPDHVIGLLAPIGGETRKSMFGGHGIFHDGATLRDWARASIKIAHASGTKKERA